MKRMVTVACRELVLYACAGTTFLSVVMTLISGWKHDWWISIFIFLFWNFVGYLFCLILMKNAFTIIYINEKEIRNKYISFCWEEIREYRIVESDDPLKYKICFPFSKPKYPDILCIGKVNGEKFCQLNKKECVFISLNRKNYNRLQAYNNGKSQAIDHLLFY